MTPSRENDWLLASDGIRARKNGVWGKEKLSFLDEFVPSALLATRGKRHRYYVDFFAGPGRNVDPDTSEEFEGSAIRALSATAPNDPSLHFTHTFLVNNDTDDQEALRQRVGRLTAAGLCRVPADRVTFMTADANRVVGQIMSTIDLRAYAFVFADITRPTHLPWSTIQQLKSGGHQSVDLYLLLPLDMALNRMLNMNPESVEQSADVSDAFFGTSAWREIHARRITQDQSPSLRRELLDFYMERLRGLGWEHVRVVRDIHREGNVRLYKMICASNHAAGGNIAKWSADKPRSDGQGNLF